MKNYLLPFCIIMLFLASCKEPIPPAQNACSEIPLVWDYPVKPGTEEWKNQTNHQEMINVCQIPENVLHSIETKNLMAVCLQYPFLSDVFAFNEINRGLAKQFDDFNGIREFAKREGAVNLLLEQYNCAVQNFSANINERSPAEIGYFTMQISMFEMLLAYKEFHINTTKEIHKQILKGLWFGYLEKQKQDEYFQGGFNTNFYARANIIIKIDASLSTHFEGNNKSVLFSGNVNTEIANLINNLTQELIK